jgi:hypothetical protein
MPANVPSNAHPSETAGDVDHTTYMNTILDHYVSAADTPATARRADRALAGSFHRRGVPLTDVIHAIRLCMLRRHKRDPALDPLEPICSLAYMRPLVEQLQRKPHDPGYVEYIYWSYSSYFIDEPPENRGSQPEGRGL